MLHDRLLGVLCLGAAILAATWGGNGALNEASAQAARAARLASHADRVAPASAPDSGEVPTAEVSSTTVLPPESSTTTAPAGASTSTTQPGEAATALAKRALLAQADMPEGFTTSSPAPPDGTAPPDTPLERCAGPDAGLATAIGARVRSATFTRPDTGSASSTAVVFDQPSSAEKALELMSSTAARSCFEGLINARLARNPLLSQDVRGSLGPTSSPPVGDGALAYRFEVRLPAEDVDRNASPSDPPVRYIADYIFVRKGRIVVLAEFANLRQPWPEATLRGVSSNLAAHA